MKVFAASKPRNDLHVNKYFNNHLIRICVMHANKSENIC